MKGMRRYPPPTPWWGLLALSQFRRHPGRHLLTLIGIVLGVAVTFAIESVNDAVLASFERTMHTIAGAPYVSVGSEAGIDETHLERLRDLAGAASVAPLIQDVAIHLASGRPLAVLAVDTLRDTPGLEQVSGKGLQASLADELAFLNDPRGIVLTRALARQNGLTAGDIVQLDAGRGPEPFRVHGTLEPEGALRAFGDDLIVMDVFAAQLAFERGRRFDRIDVVPAQGVDLGALARSISTELGASVRVQTSEARAREGRNVLEGFQLVLSLAAAVALCVGVFVTYSTMETGIARRRVELGVLRALGATRQQILVSCSLEALFMGCFGAALGLLFGIGLARAVLDVVVAAVAAMYAPVRAETVAVSYRALLQAVGMGIGVSLIGGLIPAMSAARVEPLDALREHVEPEQRVRRRRRSLSRALAVSAATTSALALWSTWDNRIGVGYAATLLMVVTSALLAPHVATATAALSRVPLLTHHSPMMLGSMNFARGARRHSVAVAALAIAIASGLSSDILLHSIKETTSRWFERTVRADIVVAGEDVQSRITRPLPEALHAQLSSVRGVDWVDASRMTRQSYGGRPFFLSSCDLEGYLARVELPLVSGELRTALPRILAGEAVAVSQSFASSFAVGVGDALTLSSAAGPRTFTVALIYVDYSAELGVVLTDRRIYRSLWRDTRVDSYDVYLEPGASPERTRADIAAHLTEHRGALAMTHAAYKSEMLGFIDSSFALARATELVALTIALLGTVNTLLVTVADRRREIAMIRAIGAAASQVRAMLVTEGVLIGLSASVLGILTGATLSLYVVRVLLRLRVGWEIEWTFPVRDTVLTFGGGLLVAGIAASIPARLASRATFRPGGTP